MRPRHPLGIGFPAGPCQLGTSTPQQHAGFLPVVPHWGPLGTPRPDGGLVMKDLCGVTDGCGVPPLWGSTSIQVPRLLGCHLCLGVTSPWVSLLLRCHLCSGRCHLSLGATSAQMPPPAGYHFCPGTTSAQVPPPHRCHPWGGREQGQCPRHRGGCCDATGYHVALGQLVTPLSFPSTYPDMNTSPLSWAPR